ncbi:hypothetical protein QBE52_10280 [Clostridiaceae bacterium 35-E11]
MKIIKENIICSIVKIASNVLDYAMNIDSLGLFHLVIITSLGELKYLVNKDHQWDCKYLFKPPLTSNHFSYPKIFIIHHAVYILVLKNTATDAEIWLLKYDPLNDHAWNHQKISDTLLGKYQIPFHVDIDLNNHIHIVYKSSNQKNHQLSYSKYQPAHHVWSIPLTIGPLRQEAIHPFIFCDIHNCVHITWSSFYQNHLQIFYVNNQQRNSITTSWSNVRRLSNEGKNCSFPFMMQIKNIIKVIWKENGTYHVMMRNMIENQWKHSEEILFNPQIKLFPTIILGNSYKAIAFVKAPMTYSLITDDFCSMGIDSVSHDKISNPNVAYSNTHHMQSSTESCIVSSYKNSVINKSSSQNLCRQNTSKTQSHIYNKKHRSEWTFKNPTKLSSTPIQTKNMSPNIPQFSNHNEIILSNKVLKENESFEDIKKKYFSASSTIKKQKFDAQFKELIKMMEEVQESHAYLKHVLDVINQRQKDENKKINDLIHANQQLSQKSHHPFIQFIKFLKDPLLIILCLYNNLF